MKKLSRDIIKIVSAIILTFGMACDVIFMWDKLGFAILAILMGLYIWLMIEL